MGAFAVVMALVVFTTRRGSGRPADMSTISAVLAPDGSSDPPSDVFKILVVGDSTANSLGWTLRGVHRPNVEIELFGRDGCTMLHDTCYGDRWSDQARATKPDAVFFFVGGAFMHQLEDDRGRVLTACQRDWHGTFEAIATKRLRELVAMRAARVFTATLPFGLKSWASRELHDQVICINRSIRRLADAVPGLSVIELADRVCPKGVCIVREDGLPHEVRPDGVHYDMDGARPLSTWLLDELRAAGAQQR